MNDFKYCDFAYDYKNNLIWHHAIDFFFLELIRKYLHIKFCIGLALVNLILCFVNLGLT